MTIKTKQKRKTQTTLSWNLKRSSVIKYGKNRMYCTYPCLFFKSGFCFNGRKYLGMNLKLVVEFRKEEFYWCITLLILNWTEMIVVNY